MKLIVSITLFLCTFSISAQEWQQVGDSPFRDDHTNGFGFEGVAYVFRGTPTNTEDGNRNEVWTYTPATDTWDLMTTFPGDARNISIGDDWNGKYYYGFGIGGPDGLLNDLWEFDPVDTSFTQLPSCPCVGRSHPSLIAHNDKIFMGAGSSFGGDLNDWWEYDMKTQVWTQKESIPGPVRHHMFHFSIGNYVYVGGGHVANWNRYDPELEEWTPIDDLPQGRVAGTQFQYGDLGFILAGDDRFHDHVPDVETFMYYSEETKEWDYLPQLPNGSRWAPSSFIVDDELFFAAGLSNIINGDATMWKFDLSKINCMPPSGLNAIDIDVASAGLLWTSNAGTVTDTLKWRKVGEEIWNDVVNPTAVFQLDGLEACTDYEFKIIKICESNFSESQISTFRTDGCCINPDVTFTSITPNSALVEWAEVTAADEYNIRWRSTDAQDWSVATVASGPFQLTDLDECTEYEFQIESICMISDIEYSESTTFLTRDCGSCLDIEYCSVEESFSGEFVFVNKVGINQYENISGNNGGYANFEDSNAEEILIGETFDFTIEPGYVQGSFAFAVRVWIDLDGNGAFDADELVLLENSVNQEITVEVLIPENSLSGLTRMRVLYSNETDPCSLDDNFVFGEVEDYCIILLEKVTSTLDLGNKEMVAFPNPTNHSIRIEDTESTQFTFDVSLVNLVGEVVFQSQNYRTGEEIDLSNLSNGVYFLMVETEEGIRKIRVVKQD